MREIVVISGKGGTGKTSLAGAFAVLAGKVVLCDCDVDAPDLHLIMKPETIETHEFVSGYEALIRTDDCVACGYCKELCRFEAVREITDECGSKLYLIDHLRCEGCRVCAYFCPAKAVELRERSCGYWFISRIPGGSFVHARLKAGADNSGKLVSLVRREGRRLAEKENISLIVSDGPPGIGCPVIASVTGCDLVLIVAEPTVSGEHDMRRVCSLVQHFGIRTAVCINKWDLNPEMTVRIEEEARKWGAKVVGRIAYDGGFTEAQRQGRTVIEAQVPSAEEIKTVWYELIKM